VSGFELYDSWDRNVRVVPMSTGRANEVYILDTELMSRKRDGLAGCQLPTGIADTAVPWGSSAYSCDMVLEIISSSRAQNVVSGGCKIDSP